MGATTIWIGMGCKQVGIKNIWQSMQKSVEKLNQKSLEIPKGNLVLLHDHLEGGNKVQDQYKNEEFVVVGKCPGPNVHSI